MTESLMDAVKENKVTLLLLEGERYHSQLLDVLKALTDSYDDILHVTVTQPYHKLKEDFTKAGIDLSRLFVIDTTPQAIKIDEEEGNYLRTGTPSSLLELNITITKYLEKNPAFFIFDSLHTLTAYHPQDVVVRFAHEVISKISSVESKAVFPTVMGDKNTSLIGDLEMFVDKVVEL